MPKPMIIGGIYLFLEIAAFILVGQWLGVGPTLLLILFTSVCGVFLLRTQGMKSAYRTLEGMQNKAMPFDENDPDVFLIFAGILLFLPGFITDFLGFLLWFPPIRYSLKRRSALFFKKATRQSPTQDAPGSRVIEGEFERKDD